MNQSIERYNAAEHQITLAPVITISLKYFNIIGCVSEKEHDL